MVSAESQCVQFDDVKKSSLEKAKFYVDKVIKICEKRRNCQCTRQFDIHSVTSTPLLAPKISAVNKPTINIPAVAPHSSTPVAPQISIHLKNEIHQQQNNPTVVRPTASTHHAAVIVNNVQKETKNTLDYEPEVETLKPTLPAIRPYSSTFDPRMMPHPIDEPLPVKQVDPIVEEKAHKEEIKILDNIQELHAVEETIDNNLKAEMQIVEEEDQEKTVEPKKEPVYQKPIVKQAPKKDLKKPSHATQKKDSKKKVEKPKKVEKKPKQEQKKPKKKHQKHKQIESQINDTYLELLKRKLENVEKLALDEEKKKKESSKKKKASKKKASRKKHPKTKKSTSTSVAPVIQPVEVPVVSKYVVVHAKPKKVVKKVIVTRKPLKRRSSSYHRRKAPKRQDYDTWENTHPDARLVDNDEPIPSYEDADTDSQQQYEEEEYYPEEEQEARRDYEQDEYNEYLHQARRRSQKKQPHPYYHYTPQDEEYASSLDYEEDAYAQGYENDYYYQQPNYQQPNYSYEEASEQEYETPDNGYYYYQQQQQQLQQRSQGRQQCAYPKCVWQANYSSGYKQYVQVCYC